MKKIFGLLFIIPQLLLAQQNPYFSFSVNVKNDTIGKYNVTLQKYNSTDGINTNEKAGASIKLNDFLKQNFKAAPDTFAIEDDHWQFYFVKGHNEYKFSEDEEGWQSINVITIEDKKSKAKMQIIVPVLTNAKWTEIYISNIVFEANKIMDVTTEGKFLEEDNTLKIVLDAKGKPKGKLKSIFQKTIYN